jgi:hypothetical protein
LDNDYFIGRWSADQEAGCNNPNSEFLDFDDQGIIRISLLGQLESVGFWELEDGLLFCHLLALPALFTGHVQKPTDQIGYYRLRSFPFNVEENEFSAAVSFEGFL